jgi:hypothetical protein
MSDMFFMTGEKVLMEGVNRLGRPIYLVFRREGMYPAGSRSIHRENEWGVLWAFEGSRHGQWHSTVEAARDHFDRINKAHEHATQST